MSDPHMPVCMFFTLTQFSAGSFGSGNFLKTTGDNLQWYAFFEKALNTIKQQLQDMKDGNFSDEDIQNSKELIIASIKGISSEQDTEITYYYGQELTDEFVSLDEYIEKINRVSKNEIQEVAKTCFVDTVYFLRD